VKTLASSYQETFTKIEIITVGLILMLQGYAFVYILTNKNHSVLYVGVTADLVVRLSEHIAKENTKSFTARYNIDKLVYFEEFQSIQDAIKREKYIKGKTRIWKIELINSRNPQWLDLSLISDDWTE
jgi:putative endonuclease